MSDRFEASDADFGEMNDRVEGALQETRECVSELNRVLDSGAQEKTAAELQQIAQLTADAAANYASLVQEKQNLRHQKRGAFKDFKDSLGEKLRDVGGTVAPAKDLD
ncbi:hypothetical protein AAVH_17489 [Aphelenchoides avenae]|nr:hypothetical protein AAVH_17489 [Aphelenchus avenae]